MTAPPNFDPIAVGDEVAGLSSKMIAVDSIGVPPSDVERLLESSLYDFVEFTWNAVTDVAAKEVRN